MALAAHTSFSAAPWRVIVTRPGREAQAWAEALQARGVPCETLPLIEIAALPEPLALAPAWPGGRSSKPKYMNLPGSQGWVSRLRVFWRLRPAGMIELPEPGVHAA